MSQKSIEFILFRQFAYYLASPVFMLDQDDNLIFCNEPAEKILGFRFSETGEMSRSEWLTIFSPQDKDGNLIQKEKSSLVMAHTNERMTYDRFYIRNILNEIKHIEVFILPILNHTDHFLGSIAFFQQVVET